MKPLTITNEYTARAQRWAESYGYLIRRDRRWLANMSARMQAAILSCLESLEFAA